MGKKPKTSRKGKKAWRANISTVDIEDFVEKSNKDAITGGSIAAASSESLFFVDKSRDLSVKRKIEKHREKVLHCDNILQRNPLVQPIAPSIRKKSKKKSKEIGTAKASVQGCQKDHAAPESGMAGIWDGDDEMNVEARKKTKFSLIPAVEVEPPGCSFNPTYESHQDSLASAVADEMQKVYRQELGPEPIPLSVPGEEVNEEERYFLDADDGTDDEDANEDPVESTDGSHEKMTPNTKRRVTRVVHNRRIRRKEKLKVESEARKLEKLSAEIDGLTDIIQEIAKEDEEKERRHLRRTVAKKERLKSFPPRLGKRKFEPAPAQVLLSDEITGSMRKLKGCCTLARDRYKSLEKRGLIIPTKKSGRK